MNWLDKYSDETPKAQNGIEGTMGGLTDKGFNYNGAWGGQFQGGGNIPGSVGFTYARTKGIPSEGPYAKKTMPSAQNGQEMRYYQHGLDFTPKGMRNGGWLDAYGDDVPKAQTGKNIKVKNADGTISVINTGSPEYRAMYKSGMVQHPSAGQDDNPYFGGILDEVSVTRAPREKGFWEKYRDKIVEENKDAGFFGAIIGTPISAVTSLPQLAATYALTDEMQRPSEALDIQNPYGAFAVDAVADPANWFGGGLADDALKLTSKGKNLFRKGFKKPFKSEIDWGKWNKEIPENSKLMKEYNTIEQISKSNNTWMKNPDGSPFQGTPEQFVQQNSKNFKKAFPNGVEEFYRGNQHFNPNLDSGNHSGFDTHITFGIKNKDIAEKYATNGGYNLNDEYQNIGKQVDFYHPDINTPGKYTGYRADVDAGIYHVGVDKNLEKKIIEGNNERWYNIDDPETLKWKRETNPDYRTQLEKGFEEKQIDKVTTDNIASYIADKQIPMAKVKNINDDLNLASSPSSTPSDVIMINPKLAKVKSLRYNNGMFDMTNPNIYKSILPFVGYTGAGALTYKALQGQEEPVSGMKQGGIIKDDRGQWAHPGEITEIGSNDITMEGVPYPVLGISDEGDVKLMQPGKNYKFKGKKVTEFPIAKNGINNLDAKPLQKLDDLTNFTNYNSSSDRGWLSKYK